MRALTGVDVSDRKKLQAREQAHERGIYPAPLNEGRSRNMQANRRSNTKPEVVLRSALHRLGYRYRKDLRLDLGDVKVRPDIVFTARKVAVFVDGCFWHVCPVHGRHPTTNEWYWTPKLRRNMERDRIVNAALEAAGWRVVRLWEHEDLTSAVETVVAAVDPGPEHVSDNSGSR
ncbi:very short patch repair endonuclease [Nonomuraea ferruginea]|uniref:Very short patch repair endonuclease n=1 Tax=Nonomuraea ferruginea TaxID=46174 RepID=A0ABT4SQM0_9ACTN|nr:very short patch repair endonuclease [Nonomuraea ferruginea]MDA0639534.1 very short patch repair endonuclease [Nonomuraea ferruginea]